MTNELIIEIEGYGNIVVHKDTTLYDLIKRLNKTDDIIACSINNEIVELSYKLKEDTKLKLISIKDRMGAKIYRSGLKFIYITAIKELFGINTDVKLLHSLDKGIYTRIDLDLTVDIVKDIKAKMEEMAKSYGKDVEELSKNENLKNYLAEGIKSEKALEFIVNNAKVTEKKKETKKATSKK